MDSVFLRGRPYRIGLEMIDFQKDDFGVRLEACISDIKKAYDAKKYVNARSFEKGPEAKTLRSTISDRLGLTVVLVCDTMDAAIMPFYSNKNHIFLHEYWRGNISIKDQNKLLNASEGKKGYVDAKRARLGGIFSEYENELYLNFPVLFYKYQMSNAEITAVLLHELGHAFTACEYADRLESANQVLGSLAQDLATDREKKNVEYIYREISKVNPKITMEEADKLVHGQPVIAGYTWFKVVVGTTQSQMGNHVYDRTAFEQMSDNFAARFGYGRQIVVALEKMYKHYSPNVEKSRAWAFFCAFLSTLLFVIYLVALFSGMLTIFPFIIVCLCIWAMFRGSGDDMKDFTYDELKIRYKRVRQQLVEVLKDVDTKKQKIMDLLGDVYMLDRIIDETNRYVTPLRVAANFVFTNARTAKNSNQEQQLMEELAFNDLFVKAAHLRTA